MLDRIWPPFHERIQGLYIAAVAPGAFGLLQLAIRYAAPSDPYGSGTTVGLALALGLAAVVSTVVLWALR
jgi:hypothetical protein